MVSRLECTRAVHFVQVSVSVPRPEDPDLGLGLKTWSPRSRSWSQDSMHGTYAYSTITVICSTFKRVLCHQLELMQSVMWSRDHGLETRVHSSSFCPCRSRSRSRDLKSKVSVLVSRPKKRSWQQHWSLDDWNLSVRCLVTLRLRWKICLATQTFGFPVAGPTFWNSLAGKLRTYSSDRFKAALKTKLSFSPGTSVYSAIEALQLIRYINLSLTWPDLTWL